LDPIFEPEADRVLAELEADPKHDRFLNATWEVIESVLEDPTSAFARRRALRTEQGHFIWMVPIPVLHQGERWVILWQPRGGEMLVAYVGPEDFRSAYI
jgi:hypothetical protein